MLFCVQKHCRTRKRWLFHVPKHARRSEARPVGIPEFSDRAGGYPTDPRSGGLVQNRPCSGDRPGKGPYHGRARAAMRPVSAVELDGRLYERLCRTFPAGGPVRLYHQDFLTWPLPKSDYVVFANIPVFHHLCHPAAADPGAAILPGRRGWLWKRELPNAIWAARKRHGNRCCSPHGLTVISPIISEGKIFTRPQGWKWCSSISSAGKHPTCPGDSTGRTRPFANAVSAAEPDALRRILTRNQLTAALRDAGLPRDFRSADMRYVQWLLPVPMGRTVRQNRRASLLHMDGGTGHTRRVPILNIWRHDR